MRYIILLLALSSLLFSSCENETISDNPRQVQGTFSSTEVNISVLKSQVDLPDFPFQDVVEIEDYTMQVISNEGNVLEEWTQSLNESFQFETTGAVIFETTKEVDYTLPKSTYTLYGRETVEKDQTYVNISMNNTSYSGIAIFSDYVKTVSIDGHIDLPVVDVEGGTYSYSFVDPEENYTVRIEDVQDNDYTLLIKKSQLDINEMLRIYIVATEVDGEFEIIYDWEYTDIPLN